MRGAADGFRLEAFYTDGTSAIVIEASPMDGLFRLLELYPWREGQRITITPLYSTDEPSHAGAQQNGCGPPTST